MRNLLSVRPLLVAFLLASPAVAQLEAPPEPAGNPLTTDKANLGKVLFWDEQLSSTRTVACGTCHIPKTGGGDPRSLASAAAIHPGPDALFGGADDVHGSPGVPRNDAEGDYTPSPTFGFELQVTGRRTPSSINAGYATELFWDGRAGEELVDPVTQQTVLASGAALETQALGPFVSDVEMANVGRTHQDLLDRIAEIEPLAVASHVPTALSTWIAGRTYEQLFDDVFGGGGITAARVAMAIASYERTQFTDQTPLDTFLQTDTGLTPQEIIGRNIFSSAPARCNRCHFAPLLGDDGSDPDLSFAYIGVRPTTDDPGRFAVTADPDDVGKMRVPSLRNLELRAPYMHNGRFGTIEEVVEFYDRGGDFTAPNKDPFIQPLGLTTQQKADLVAFLKRPLTDPRLENGEPPFDRPTLFTETGDVPRVYGSGVASIPGGVVPQVVALEPPLLGNPSFTVTVRDADGGVEALLVIDEEEPGTVPPGNGTLAFETAPLTDDGNGRGYASVSIALPTDPALDGAPWFGRWYVLDAEADVVAVSPPFRFKTFAPGALGHLFEDGFEDGGVAFWSSSVP